MHVTILADASHCPTTKAAGYGFWIASGRGKWAGHGALRGRIATSTQAEMMAVVNALHTAIVRQLVAQEDVVLMQIDCLAAIDSFNRARQLLEEEVKVVDHYDKLCKAHRLVVMFRHVKAHTGKGGSRFVSNSHCDKSAKKEMRRQRGRFICEDALKLLRGENETNARRGL